MTFDESENNLRSRLAERLDALGAQGLDDQAALFHQRNLLQVRFELAVGCTLRKRAAVAEGGRLAAVVAFSHFDESFPYDDADRSLPFLRAGHFTIKLSLVQ